mmetsp:Transcript_11024/g.19299  ORF Transcript_11024/g.19299 Transcript_11024/m.19299 type:complete len:268 (-) Transcript_11024:108-911(-)
MPKTPAFLLGFPQVAAATAHQFGCASVRRSSPPAVAKAAASLSKVRFVSGQASTVFRTRKSGLPSDDLRFLFNLRAEGATEAVETVPAESAKPPKAEAPAFKEPDVSRLNLRVGKVVKAWKHPDADSLYCEEIDVGEEEPRLICSGLVQFVPIEEFEGSMVVVLANLKARNMRGVKSNGMVLAASNADHTQVELIIPPEGSQPGERVSFEGFEGDADATLNPKKKVWEAVQPDLKTDSHGVATYKGVPFMTSAGPCTAKSLTNSSIG